MAVHGREEEVKKKKMGRTPCCDKDGVKKGAWSPEEDRILVQYIQKHGHGSWRSLPKNAGLLSLLLLFFLFILFSDELNHVI